MRAVFGSADAVARETQTQFRRGTDKIVGPPGISAVCRLFWPSKTAAHVAAFAKSSERTAERWLSGEFPFPIEVWIAVMQRMNARE